MTRVQSFPCKGVLVIDDDEDIRDSLVEALTDEGFAVTAATNGAEALAVLRTTADLRPCVIVLDLMMPVMDGWQFRAEQQKDAALAEIPVVVLSADGNVRTKAARLAAADALAKPVRLEMLLSVLSRYCAPANG